MDTYPRLISIRRRKRRRTRDKEIRRSSSSYSSDLLSSCRSVPHRDKSPMACRWTRSRASSRSGAANDDEHETRRSGDHQALISDLLSSCRSGPHRDKSPMACGWTRSRASSRDLATTTQVRLKPDTTTTYRRGVRLQPDLRPASCSSSLFQMPGQQEMKRSEDQPTILLIS